MSDINRNNMIFAIGGYDINIYDSLADLKADIEPDLVGEYSIYRQDGSRVVTRRSGADVVGLDFTDPTQESEDNLRMSLLDCLEYRGLIKTPCDLSLEQIVNMAILLLK